MTLKRSIFRSTLQDSNPAGLEANSQQIRSSIPENEAALSEAADVIEIVTTMWAFPRNFAADLLRSAFFHIIRKYKPDFLIISKRNYGFRLRQGLGDSQVFFVNQDLGDG
ncbi:MAG: hypothetical protein HPY50_15735 [Firmicutes bacterium]|nr:hypothetical protein [Bacillota bacterium]